MEFTIKLSLEETNLVLGALSKLSYEASSGLIESIKGQANSQIAAAQVKEKEAEKKAGKRTEELTPA